jgi:hypothetical protein
MAALIDMRRVLKPRTNSTVPQNAALHYRTFAIQDFRGAAANDDRLWSVALGAPLWVARDIKGLTA